MPKHSFEIFGKHFEKIGETDFLKYIHEQIVTGPISENFETHFENFKTVSETSFEIFFRSIPGAEHAPPELENTAGPQQQNAPPHK